MTTAAPAAAQTNPETGDNNGLTVTAIIAALALLGLAVLGVNELVNRVRAGR
jgi:LPXTG-motif cell wall-anchored protein